MADTVKIKITGEGFEKAQAKVDALNEKLAEAKELAAELASALEALRLDFKWHLKVTYKLEKPVFSGSLPSQAAYFDDRRKLNTR